MCGKYVMGYKRQVGCVNECFKFMFFSSFFSTCRRAAAAAERASDDVTCGLT